MDAVAAYDHCSDGNLSCLECRMRFVERTVHIELVLLVLFFRFRHIVGKDSKKKENEV